MHRTHPRHGCWESPTESSQASQDRGLGLGVKVDRKKIKGHKKAIPIQNPALVLTRIVFQQLVLEYLARMLLRDNKNSQQNTPAYRVKKRYKNLNRMY